LDEKKQAWWKIRSSFLEWEGKLNRSEILQLLAIDEQWNNLFTRSVAIPEFRLAELKNHRLFKIGSHTVNHLPLKKLPEEQVRFELQESKRYLENLMDCEVRHLAYPYGSPNECGEREYKIAKECGYLSGVTFNPGNITGNNLNSFALPRFAGGEEVKSEKLNHILNGIKHFADHY